MPVDDLRAQRQHKDFRIGERVLIQDTNKRTVQDIKGRLATVTDLPGNGWVMAQLDGGEAPFRIQQRYLCHAPPAAGSLALPSVVPIVAKSPAVADPTLPPRPLKVRIIAPPSDARPSSAPGLEAGAAGGATAGRGDAVNSAAAAAGVAATPKSPGVATPGMLREVLRKLRGDMMDAEAHVPWSAVRSMWRSRRAKWRQLTKVAETVPELAVRLSEFRSALITDSTFVGCGATWQKSLEACMGGSGRHAVLLGVWEELRQAIGAWLDVRQRPQSQQTAALQVGVARALAALQRAAEQGTDALAQVPLEAILNNSVDGLQAVRALIEKERKAAALEAAKASTADADNAAAAGGSAAAVQGLSPRASSETGCFGVPVDDFDSGAETDYGSGSCVTGMNLSDSD